MIGASFKRLWQALRGAKGERSAHESRRAELLARKKQLDEVKKDYDEARRDLSRQIERLRK